MAENAAAGGPLPVVPYLKISDSGDPYLEGHEFAEAGQEHARKYGTTFEQFAKVSVKNHHHSVKNPKSMYQKETPLEMVMNAEMIAYPNTKLMCSVNVDGSAAAVLASEKKARELGMGRKALAAARP